MALILYAHSTSVCAIRRFAGRAADRVAANPAA